MRSIMREKLDRLLPPLFLLAVTFAVYWSSTGHEFLTGWDDPTYVTKNEVIKGFTWDHVRTAFTTYYVGNYAPVQLISYMVDYSIWGLRAKGFLFTNILFHAGSGVTLYFLLRRIYGNRIWIILAALFFLLHPVQVESVVWISQRKNVAAIFFFLISWYCYDVYQERDGRLSTVVYLVSLVAFSLAILSKSVAVILPPVLLLFNVCIRGKRLKELCYALTPYVIIAGLAAVLALKSQSPEFDGGRVHTYYGGSLLNTAFTMLPVVARYLGMLFWPANLSAWYDPPIRSSADTAVILSGLLVVVLIGCGIILWRRKRDCFFWYALFFIGLVPVSQIVPLTTLMNDRYLYFPLLGAAPFFCAMLLPTATAVDLLCSGRQLMLATVLSVAVVLCAITTFQRSAVWKDSVTLWSDTVSKTPNVHLVHHGLGCALLQAGRIDEAITELTTALKLNQGNVETFNQLGIAYGKIGEFDRAIELFEIALRIDPSSEPARINLSLARYGKDRYGRR